MTISANRSRRPGSAGRDGRRGTGRDEGWRGARAGRPPSGRRTGGTVRAACCDVRTVPAPFAAGFAGFACFAAGFACFAAGRAGFAAGVAARWPAGFGAGDRPSNVSGCRAPG
jgi:hypothetical protein